MITKIHPDRLPFEALNFLHSAIRKTPHFKCSINDILKSARSGDGEIYLVETSDLLGVFYIQTDEDFLNLILFGGENIQVWAEEFQKFITGLMRERGVSNLYLVGRPGLKKLFKELKHIGDLYSLGGG